MEHRCQCGSAHNETELGPQYNLQDKIDLDNVACLNELVEDSGKTVFKSWEKRLDRTKYVESDVDDELLFNIPFTGNMKLKGMIIIGGPDNTHPSVVKLYKNRPNMTFDETAGEADQEFELFRDEMGVHEYPLKVVKFNTVHHLTMHFKGNSGAERTRIEYIGFKGEWSPPPKQGVVICNYELLPQVSDHPHDTDDFSREVS